MVLAGAAVAVAVAAGALSFWNKSARMASISGALLSGAGLGSGSELGSELGSAAVAMGAATFLW